MNFQVFNLSLFGILLLALTCGAQDKPDTEKTLLQAQQAFVDLR
jgi:hypothetical protein